MKATCHTLRCIAVLFLLLNQRDFLFGQLSSSNLPIIVINTNSQTIVDEPKITCDMGIIYNGPGVINNLTDPFNHYNGKIGIEIRGSSSSSFPQKSYGFETRTPFGINLNVPLLGMPTENDWVLHAPYTDKSLLRNVLTYQLWNEMGHYGPRTRFCELVINGNYRGVYVLVESIKKDNDRVDIATLQNIDIAGDELTGGYIIKIDKYTGTGGGWTSSYLSPAPASHSIDFLYHYPKDADIVAQQRTYIQNFMYDMETTLQSPTFTDPVNGYTKYMSINSFIDYLITNEISKNVDGYRISSFFHKNKDSQGGKLKAGPVWDYNIAWWNADYCQGNSYTGWAFNFPSTCPGDGYQVPFWWSRLQQDPVFVEKLRCRYENLRTNVLQISKLNTYIDKYVNDTLTVPAGRHFTRWPILGTYVWPNPNTPSTYAGEITNLKTWINNRLTWMDANLPGTCTTLPANLVSFTGSRKDNVVTLQWTTGHENALDKFVIEYSTNGKDYTEIGEVSARNLSTTQHYTFPYNDNMSALYRLKMVDKNGTIDYSDLVSIAGEEIPLTEIEIYPNPFTDQITFGYTLFNDTNLEIELLNATGTLVQQFTHSDQPVGKYVHTIDQLGALPSGTYVLKIRTEKTVLCSKVIKL